jgi:multidrug resistance efflux pump
MKFFPILLVTLAAHTICISEEIVAVKQQSFSQTTTFAATLLPETPHLISIDSPAWHSFIIEEIVPHGSLVRKGDTLIRFDAEEYDKKVQDAESSHEASKLQLANAEADYAAAVKYQPMQMESATLKKEHAAEAWHYFQKTSRESKTREANLQLRSAELRLDAEREELKQLEKMYKADDLTENTEEIILKRQHEAVKFAEAALEDARLEHKRTLEVHLPRLAISLEREAKSTAIAFQENEENIPRNLKLKHIALADARVKAKRDRQSLRKLGSAQPEFVIKAPADGYFYYGTIQDGRWTVGDSAKALAPQSPAPVNRPFATVIPTEAIMKVEAFVDEPSMRQLSVSQKGYARLVGQEHRSFPTQVARIAPTPALDGRYRVTLDMTGSDLTGITPASNVKITIVSYQKNDALSLPVKALHSTDSGGWEVELKQEGKDNLRVLVTRGLTSGDEVEIISGISKGQQVIVP